ncbi:hypothetical protein WX45_01819 [Clostridium ljungdahlii DSM 13528]|uniref:Uncharacterized protein n=1 Tax=Clostridium ljungdahlii (strain ATCC 55383 / DSM 13528 / PETC) TaxID=748727 RepID=A0ABX2TP26_CLOLD|nr:hypothetical protein WX45_01819 [Clostridium ljungdahlii DSM 13528]
MFLIVFTISSGSVESTHIGIAFTFANLLSNNAFPSTTGRPAAGPIFPSPNTAVPFVTTATVFPFIVYSYAFSSSLAISRHGPATPGV